LFDYLGLGGLIRVCHPLYPIRELLPRPLFGRVYAVLSTPSPASRAKALVVAPHNGIKVLTFIAGFIVEHGDLKVGCRGTF